MSEQNGATVVEEKPAHLANPKILLGVPVLAWTHEFATSFLELWTSIMTAGGKGRNLACGYKFEYRKPVHMAQEALAEFAVASGCTHLLLMDDDIYDVRVEDIFKLIDADKDVVGGIMYTSGFPHAMCAFRRYNLDTRVADQPILDGAARLYEIPEDQRVGLQECDLIPFGFTLIKTEVFKKIQKPWFQCNTQAPTDSWFMDSIMDAGIKPYAHFDVWLNHRGVKRDNRHLHVQIGMIEAQKKSNVITLSPEDMNRHMMAMDLKLKEAEKERKVRDVAAQPFHNIGEEKHAVGAESQK